VKVALSTASTFPDSVESAFEIASRLGYDGVELMPLGDPVSQDLDAVRRLSGDYGVPVLSVHAPCLLATQRVWSTNPWRKLVTARRVAEALGAATVVVHPPFRWQREYARRFVQGIERMADHTDVAFAVENMFPWRAGSREVAAYMPGWDPRDEDYPAVTLDLSHTAVSGTDAMAMATDLGSRLTHVHLADGSGSARDEHLVPGRGSQPCAELLGALVSSGFDGTVVLEVSTRKAVDSAARERDLAEALAFTRTHVRGQDARPAD